jgi:hypothetical protein
MERQQEKQTPLELSPQIVTMMTTEHFTLQTAQAQEISDLNGRMSLFIGAVSSTLIALAFIGQISGLRTAFFVFSLVLFPSLFFMGLVTFERVIQSTYAVIVYARGINRIRHLYVPRDAQRDGLDPRREVAKLAKSCLDLLLLWDAFAYFSFWFLARLPASKKPGSDGRIRSPRMNPIRKEGVG